MQYYTLSIKDKELKCRLTAKASVDLEKKLGTNPLNIIAKAGLSDEVPSIGALLTILHASLQSYQHGYSMDKVYELYDEYVEEGKTIIDLIPEIIEIFKVSGFFTEEQEQQTKN